MSNWWLNMAVIYAETCSMINNKSMRTVAVIEGFLWLSNSHTSQRDFQP